MEKVEACINCGSRDLRRWVEGRDRLLGIEAGPFVYSRCGDCGIALQTVRPSESEIGRFYTEGYGPYASETAKTERSPAGEQRNRKFLEHADRILGDGGFRERIKQFYARMGPGTLFLDFGCGSGKFLHRARKAGCTTVGIDFSPTALAEAAKRGHRALPASDEGWAELADGSVDMVRMSHVVEHLYAPRDTLTRIFGKMRPGGTIHISVPNPRGLSARLFGRRWFALDCPRHIVLFTPEALARHLAEIGFAEIEVLHEPLTKDLVRSFAYLLEDCGFRRRGHIDELMTHGPLNFLFALPGRFAWRTGRGDRIHVLAARP